MAIDPGASKAFDLTQLNQWVCEREGILGPITALADGGTATAGHFDTTKPRPAPGKCARVFIKVGAACVLDPNMTELFHGQAYINNLLRDVCVGRPN